jgi:SAM-dependent methyltransferase
MLGGSVRALEIGCGTGIYGTRIGNNVKLQSYFGVDLFQNRSWVDVSSGVMNFRQDSYENFTFYAGESNLIITQSALEHFDKDLKLFREIDEFAASKGFPVVSIHLFPSAFCLFTFLWHGIRQYGKLPIRRLFMASPRATFRALYSLGGIHSNIFHLKRITFASVFKRTPLVNHDPGTYFRDLVTALSKDGKNPSLRLPAFHAIVLAWNVNSKELDGLFSKIH